MLPLAMLFLWPLLVNLAMVRANSYPVKKGSSDEVHLVSKVGNIDDDLINIHAFIVKDDAPKLSCRTRMSPLTPTDNLYVMCAATILSTNFLLSSGSCFRDGVGNRRKKEQLAAMIGPFAKIMQIVSITEFFIHPDFKPDGIDVSDHNIGVAKLHCRILKNNYYPIKLPTEPLLDLCAEESCAVAIISKMSLLSFSVQQTNGQNKHLEGRMKRQNIENSYKLDPLDNYMMQVINDTAAFKLEKDRLGNFIEGMKELSKVIFENQNSSRVSRRSIGQKSHRHTSEFFKIPIVQYGRGKKRLSVRSTNGITDDGCAMTGTPVMSENTQAGLVAASCDEKHPHTPWQYTDIYDSVDWIKEKISGSKCVMPCFPCFYGIPCFAGCMANPEPPHHSCQSLPSIESSEPIAPDNDRTDVETPENNDSQDVRSIVEELVRRVFNKIENNKYSELSSRVDPGKGPQPFFLDLSESKRKLNYNSPNGVNDYENLLKLSENAAPYDNINDLEGKDVNDNDIRHRRFFPETNTYNLLKRNKVHFQEFLKGGQFADSRVAAKYLVLFRKFLDERKNLNN